MGFQQILSEISTRMGTRTLAVAVLEANSVMVATKKHMKKLTPRLSHPDIKWSLDESHSDRPSCQSDKKRGGCTTKRSITPESLPDSWQPLDRAKPPPRRMMTPHGNLFSMPLSPPHSRIGGMDCDWRIGTIGQNL